MGHWQVRLSIRAQADFDSILLWTADQFGDAQAAVYNETLSDALYALSAGPDIIGVRRRDDIGSGFRTLHVARNRRRGRHFLLFRVTGPAQRPVISIARILHDAMDPVRHLPDRDET